MTIFGTRPEAIKMAPVIAELQKYPSELQTIITLTAQHREMLDQVLDIFEIEADYDLNCMIENQSLSDITCNIIKGMESIFEAQELDLVLVQGDTATTFAASLTAFYHKIPIGHIEAGLRTRNKYYPFPEEINRTLTSSLADLHFAPTLKAKENLLSEGIPDKSIKVTGNTVIDALFSIIEKMGFSNQSAKDTKKILVTIHRRENFGTPMEEVCQAILDIVNQHADIKIYFPVHLNPNARSTVHNFLSNHNQIELLEPLNYFDFVGHMASAYLILTDSGGVQEEAPALGKPVLVLREETERPEGIDAGTCRLVGLNRHRIVKEVNKLLINKNEYLKMAQAINPYGDGKASQRIVKCIFDYFQLNYDS